MNEIIIFFILIVVFLFFYTNQRNKNKILVARNASLKYQNERLKYIMKSYSEHENNLFQHKSFLDFLKRLENDKL